MLLEHHTFIRSGRDWVVRLEYTAGMNFCDANSIDTFDKHLPLMVRVGLESYVKG